MRLEWESRNMIHHYRLYNKQIVIFDQFWIIFYPWTYSWECTFFFRIFMMIRYYKSHSLRKKLKKYFSKIRNGFEICSARSARRRIPLREVRFWLWDIWWLLWKYWWLHWRYWYNSWTWLVWEMEPSYRESDSVPINLNLTVVNLSR